MTPAGLYTYVPAGHYITTEDYAREHQLSPATVRRHCASGKLDAVKVGRAWLVRYDGRHYLLKRPRKKAS